MQTVIIAVSVLLSSTGDLFSFSVRAHLSANKKKQLSITVLIEEFKNS